MTVVYVHGLWLGGQESFLLRRRLARAVDAQTLLFTYSSVGATLTDNAVALERYLATIRTDTLHLVAHSLGGLVVLRLFERLASAVGPTVVPAATPEPPMAPGRVVLLGPPLRGCRSAQRLAHWPLGRAMLGAAGEGLLAAGNPRWGGLRDLGVIAGDRALGLGRLLGPMDAPNDGTVLVEETRLPGAVAVRLPVSHSGMVMSSLVARQTAAFLREGRFSHGPGNAVS